MAMPKPSRMAETAMNAMLKKKSGGGGDAMGGSEKSPFGTASSGADYTAELSALPQEKLVEMTNHLMSSYMTESEAGEFLSEYAPETPAEGEAAAPLE